MKTDEQFLADLSAYQDRLGVTDAVLCELIPIAAFQLQAIKDGLFPADLKFRERAVAALLAYEKRLRLIDDTLDAAVQP